MATRRQRKSTGLRHKENLMRLFKDFHANLLNLGYEHLRAYKPGSAFLTANIQEPVTQSTSFVQ
jgi:hypothetical protein